MRIIEKEEYHTRKGEIRSMLREGKIFIYPTDTIYGIGCDATNHDSVQKVREIKERPDKPFSIIAPTKDWIRKNCIITEKEEEWLEKIPGPYTLILKLKNSKAVADSVNPGKKTLGVRMPDHWITDIVEDFGKPIITPSANVSGNEFMTSRDDIAPQLRSRSHVLIYEGKKKGQPSTIVNLAEEAISASGKRKII